MRRVLGIALLLLFSLPLITPLLARSSAAEADLPACCRRNGAHHCAMTTQQLAATTFSDSEATFSVRPATCPAYPSIATRGCHHDLSLDAAPFLFTGLLSGPALVTQAQSNGRLARDRSRHTRGPPTTL